MLVFLSVLCSQHTIHCIFYNNTKPKLHISNMFLM